MAANYTLLEKITVGAAGASSVTFSGIPQTGYTDLALKVSARTDTTGSGNGFLMYLNGSTSSYTKRQVYGDGSVVASNSGSTAAGGLINGTTETSNTFASTDIYIPNYAGSNYKSTSHDTVSENNATFAYTLLSAGLWSNTSAVTSITLTPNAGNFVQYSTFYLYGVAKLGTTPAIVPYATGGDTIMTDGTYWYHAFKSSGTFTPAKGLSCDVLVVAGGGASGGYSSANNAFGSGGGGAGGVLAFASQGLASGTGYTVTIGAGGAGVGVDTRGNSGSNSQFGSLTAAVGGGGGGTFGASSGAALTGGSGGGAAYANTSSAAGTSGQGYAGGANNGANGSGAGGGGAAAVGSSNSGNIGGNAGAGTNSVTNWGALSTMLTTVGLGVSGYIGGGGGGGAYGTNGTGGTASGGGGVGYGSGGAGAAGTANTGGGGGGVGSATTSYSGGSGLVVLRYAV